MRDYFKTLGMVTTWTSPLFPLSTFYIVRWGADEDDLSDRVREAWAQVRSNTPSAVFLGGRAETIGWKLDKANFLTIINGVSEGYRGLQWNGQMVTQIPNGFTDRWLTDITDVKGAGDVSPRKEWSGGH